MPRIPSINQPKPPVEPAQAQPTGPLPVADTPPAQPLDLEPEVEHTDEELIRIGNQRLIPLLLLACGALMTLYLLSPILTRLAR